VIFPSTTGTTRDPNNFGKQWRTVHEDLGVPEVTTHSFRKADARRQALVVNQGGHCQASPEVETSSINRGHTVGLWGCSESVDG
jgi:hypothetical protein